MPTQATLFSQLLQHLPWADLQRAVAAHEMDKGCRVLNARSHLVALITGQLVQAHGLRDIETALASHAPTLKRRRIEPACRSTLADANRSRPAAAFEAIIPVLLGKLSPAKARQSREDLRLMDATYISPGAGAEHWAHWCKGAVAAKVHVVYDPKAQAPTFYELSAGNVNDITIAKTKTPIENGATYVFDLGYYDFGFWADLDAKGCRFVTRLKTHTHVTCLSERAVPAGGSVIGDMTVNLPSRLSRKRKNPFSKPGRMVTVVIETGKTLRLFTNDLDSPAQDIADLYKTRWQVELFFRWIKQNLKIRRFHGRSANAVRLQIAVAIITYLLLKLMHLAAKTVKSPAHFFAGVKNALFQHIDIQTLINRIERRHPRTPPPGPVQLELPI